MSDAFERAAVREEALRLEHKRERKARGARAGFRIHATVFVPAQVLLFVVWLVTGMGHPWFVYPLLGWGIGLAAHYAAIRQHFERGTLDDRHR